jgi:hypothetical protein
VSCYYFLIFHNYCLLFNYFFVSMKSIFPPLQFCILLSFASVHFNFHSYLALSFNDIFYVYPIYFLAFPLFLSSTPSFPLPSFSTPLLFISIVFFLFSLYLAHLLLLSLVFLFSTRTCCRVVLTALDGRVQCGAVTLHNREVEYVICDMM